MSHANPYVGPKPLTNDDPIFGRERELRELRYLLTSERIVLLHSPSGAGKSSLVNAKGGLCDQLRARFDVWLPTRVSQSPDLAVANRYVWSAVMGFEHELPDRLRRTPESLAATTLQDYVASRPRRPGAPANVLLIFDQFEEILRVDPVNADAKRAFFSQLGELLVVPTVWALFVLREDYLAPLDPYVRSVPTHLQQHYRIDLLLRDQAREAVVKLAQQGGRRFTSEAVDRLLKDLAAVNVQDDQGEFVKQTGEFVEPLQMQVVCRNLWDRMPAAAETIEPEDVAQFGDVTAALSDYYASSVQTIAAGNGGVEWSIRQWVEDHLITVDGIRNQVLRGAKQSEGLDNVLVQSLVDAHLVRGEQRGGAVWYELAHDRLIDPIRENNRLWSEARLSPVEKRAILWESARTEGLLFVDEELKRAKAWAASNHPVVDLREFLAACEAKQARLRKERRQSLVLRGALALAVLLALYAWRSSIQANQEKHKAQTALARSAVQDGTKLLDDGQPGQAAAYMARALRSAPDSVAATSWISDLLLNRLWWIPVAPLQLQGRVYSAAFSPDGRRVVTASADNAARVWEADTGKPVGAPLQHQGTVFAAEFSSDGRRAVTASEDKTAQVWDAGTGKPVGAPLQHQETVMSATFSPDGRRVVTASLDHTARVWEADTGKPVGAPLQHQAAVNSAVFSPDNRRVVTASDDKTARVWETDTGKPVGAPLQHQASVWFAAFSPDGGRVLTLSRDKMARVWETETSKPVGAPLQHHDEILSVAFSPDGPRLVTADADKMAVVSEADTGKAVGAPLQHQAHVYSAAFSADGRLVATASRDKTVRVWEAGTGKPVGAPLQPQAEVLTATFSPDGGRVLTVSRDSTARVWETNAGKPVGASLLHENEVRSAAFSPDGRYVVTASGDKTARVWEADTGKPVGTPLQHQAAVYTAAFSPDGRHVVTASFDKTARVWDARTGKPVGVPLQHQADVWSAAFSPDGRRVVTASEDKTARVWEAETGKSVGAPLQHRERVYSAAFSPDGRRVVTASWDKTARVWEAETGKPVGAPLQHQAAVYTAAFSPDGRRVVTASADKTARVWEADTGKAVGAPLQHQDLVYSAAFSPDGRRVVTASLDKTARVWEADTGKAVGAPLQHQALVASAAFSPDGRRVVTASADKTAQVWEADTGKPVGAPLQHRERVYSAAFSPDGRRVVTASYDHTARVWIVLLLCCASQQEADRLADLAETVSGDQVSDTGSLSFLGLDVQRNHLDALGRPRGTSPPPLSLEWIIDRFTHHSHAP